MLREASAADSEWLFQTRNDPWIASFGAGSRTFSWDEHQAWFASVQNRERHLVFIIAAPDDPASRIGTVRIDRRTESSASISAYLMQPFVGQGLGSRAIADACSRCFAQWPVLQTIDALVQISNQRSLRAFARAGFVAQPGAGELTVTRRERHWRPE